MRAALARLGTVFFCSSALSAQNPDGLAVFEKIVRPALAENCYDCHSSKAAKPSSGLVLDSKAGMLKGGNSGVPAVVPGKPDESVIVAAVRGSGNLKMPPGKKLEPYQIDGLVEWIKLGAPDPRWEAGLCR